MFYFFEIEIQTNFKKFLVNNHFYFIISVL